MNRKNICGSVITAVEGGYEPLFFRAQANCLAELFVYFF